MIDQENQGFPLVGGKLESFRDALRKQRARFRVRAGADGSSRVVQEQGQIEHVRLEKIFKELSIGSQLRVLRADQCVQLVDAKQGVLVRGVAMKKFVLHEAGELPEFRDIAPEEVDPVHQAKRSADLALSRQHRHEYFARSFCVTVSPRHFTERATKQVLQLRTEIDVMLLRDFEGAHHFNRIALEYVLLVGMEMSVANHERSDSRLCFTAQWKEAE